MVQFRGERETMVSDISDDIFWGGDGQWETLSQQKYVLVYETQENI